MTYDPERHHRRSIRWQGYDYSQAGAYFVTIVAQNRACLFGDVVDGEVRLTDAGHMVAWWWEELPGRFPVVRIDAFIVMPNHVHGIVLIDPYEDAPGASGVDRSGGVGDEGRHPGLPLRTPPVVGAGPGACPAPRPSLPEIVHWFKTKTTDDFIRDVKREGWTLFPGKVWQRNYHDRVIRDDAELERARYYIDQNPANWFSDADNPVVASCRDKGSSAARAAGTVR